MMEQLIWQELGMELLLEFLMLNPRHLVLGGHSQVLQELWTTLLEQRLESEMRARITGVKAQMESFEYYFGVCVGELVLNHADNLSKSLQSKTISAAEGQKLAEIH